MRLPSDLHRRLKMTAASGGTTSEAILIEAVRRELDRRGSAIIRPVAVPDAMNGLLAEIVIQSMPTFALIKDDQARIVWVNLYTQRALKRTSNQIVGSKITDLGLTDGIQKDTIEANIQHVLAKRQSWPSKEGMNLTGLGKVTIRAHRYIVNDALGDISFVEDDIREARFPIVDDAVQRMQQTTLDPTIETLFLPFLETAPVAIVVKQPTTNDSIIIWGNKEYLDLIRTPASKAFGQPSTSVLRIAHDHPIINHELEVARTGHARMAKERFQDHAARWSLRFPIHDAHGKIPLIGVVSPDFKQTDERHPQ
jgi:PAS domain-containing protein